MSEQEYIDIYNENFEHIGMAMRAEAHRRGSWHQTVHCWVLRREHAHEYLLLQRRAATKLVFPGLLDVTVAGHLLQGETVADAGREVTEELGLVVQPTDLVYLGVKHDCAVVGGMILREFAHVFLLERNQPLEAYRLQADEVAGLVQMEVHAGLRLFSGEVDSVPVVGVEVDEHGKLRPIERDVSRGDFVPCVDNYYLKLAIMAERLFRGERYLAI